MSTSTAARQHVCSKPATQPPTSPDPHSPPPPPPPFMVLCAVCHAGRPGARKDKGPKASKEAALRAAEERAARLADAAQRQDRELLAAEAWRSALSRAAGDKVLDDPKLLRRSIKRDQKDRARKGKRWAERVASQQEQQRSRQERCVCVATLASGMRGMGGGALWGVGAGSARN